MRNDLRREKATLAVTIIFKKISIGIYLLFRYVRRGVEIILIRLKRKRYRSRFQATLFVFFFFFNLNDTSLYSFPCYYLFLKVKTFKLCCCCEKRDIYTELEPLGIVTIKIIYKYFLCFL